MADKQILARYVHDLLEVQIQIRTLQELEHSLRDSQDNYVKNKKGDLSSLKHEHDDEILKLTESISDTKSFLKDYQKKHENKCKLRDRIVNESWYFDPYSSIAPPALWVLICSVTCVILSLLIIVSIDPSGNNNMLALLGGVLGLPSGYLVAYCIQKKKWNAYHTKSIDKYNTEIESLNKAISTREKYLAELESKYQEARTKYSQERERLENEIAQAQTIYNELTTHIENIHKLTQAIYEQWHEIDYNIRFKYNKIILPSEYRGLEHLIAFDEMFRKAQVDTIKDAILLYEERVFRGEMITGIDNIKRNINNLGEYMAETISVLNQIDNDVNHMSQEIYQLLSETTTTVSGHLAAVNSKLGKLFGESNSNKTNIASRLEYYHYANDAISRIQKNLAWYEEQHKLGLI